MFRSRSTSASQPMGTGLYGPIVVALAIFLIVVGIGRIPSGRFLAMARLQGTASSEVLPSISIDAIQSQLADAQFVRAAMADAHPLVIGEEAIPSAATILDSLAVDVEPNKASGQLSLRLEFVSDSAVTAEAVVNAMGHHFVHERSHGPSRLTEPAYRNRHQQATRAVAESERQHTMAKRAMDTFLSNHFDQLRQPPVGRPRSATNRTTATGSLRTTFASLPPTLSNVAALQSRMTGLTQKRAAMLETMTSSHPSVQDLSRRIAHVERQLADAATAQTQRQAEVEANQVAAAEAAKTRDQLVLEFKRLNNAVAQAANVREAAREAEHRAWEREGDQRPAITWQVLPAMSARRVPEPISRGTLLLGSALAMIGGSGVIVARRRGRTLDSVSDVEMAFQSHVVGTVAEPAGVSATNVAHRSRKLRTWIVCSEVVLLVALGAMIVVALIDKDFGIQLRADPLSALVDGTHRLLQIFCP